MKYNFRRGVRQFNLISGEVRFPLTLINILIPRVIKTDHANL